MVQSPTLSGLVVRVIASCCFLLAQVSQSHPSTLLKRLQVESTTDNAENELLALAEDDQDTREYLQRNLPDLIEKGPKSNPHTWVNEVKLAGELRITAAIPALVTWMGADDVVTNVHTIPEVEKLVNNPAAKSLAEIGDPAVPAVSDVLKSGTNQERMYAVYILKQIGSPAALDALNEQSHHEQTSL